MDKRGRDGDQASGSAVAGEAELVIGLAQVRLAARASRAVAARDDALDDHARAASGESPVTMPVHSWPSPIGVPDERGVDLTADDLQIGAAQPDQIGPHQRVARRRDGRVAGGQDHLAGRAHDECPDCFADTAGFGQVPVSLTRSPIQSGQYLSARCPAAAGRPGSR